MDQLKVLSSHLGAKTNSQNESKDTLVVTNTRTGQRYTLNTEGNYIRALELNKILDTHGRGYVVYDPGYLNTAMCVSAISYIHGDMGVLQYRGYPIEQLAAEATFDEAAYLLMFGGLPTSEQLAQYQSLLQDHYCVPVVVEDVIRSFQHEAHPMGMLMSAMAAMGTTRPSANPCIAGQNIYTHTHIRVKEMLTCLGAMSTVAANILRYREGRQIIQPNSNLTFTENFLWMISQNTASASERPNQHLVKALDTLFLLHAEHEVNCSTAATRHLASSNVDVYTTISGAIGALYGPRHGGANEAVVRMLQKIGSVSNVPSFIQRVKRREERLMGFGHRVYKNYDPRASIIRKVADDVFKAVDRRDPLLEIALELERVALKDDFFMSRKLYPNVDFYSGLIYRAMGFPSDYFTVLFAVPRCAGWLAHWNEFQDDTENRIVRPLQKYGGIVGQRFIPMRLREEPQNPNMLEQAAANNMSDDIRKRLTIRSNL